MMQGGNLNHLRIPLTDIRRATNDFSETCFIGSGSFGKVYKAELEHFEGINLLVAEGANDGVLPKKLSTVAIKRISDRVDGQGKQGFLTEIEMLSKCRHANIVSLLGFCDEESEMILVYEYVSKGSLDKYLGNGFNLTRARRLQICLDIAHGLNYLHAGTNDKKTIVHRDIKSANILLDDNWMPKIADFGFSKLHDAGQQHSTIATNNVAGTLLYLDPEYMITGKLKTKSDMYSLGVVFFEIMCGKLAYDKIYNEKGLPSLVRHNSKKGTLTNLVDPKVKDAGETVSMQKDMANQYSLDPFLEVASKCLAKKQSDRPTIEEIIEELAKALAFQNTISLEAIKWGRKDSTDSKCIGQGRFWKLYEGEVAHANGCTPVLVKRWDTTYDQRHISFLKELDILYRYKHENIIAIVGHFSVKDENIIVYEHASNRSLDKHLCDPNLTWIKRLKICLDIAKGLEYLHEGYVGHKYLVEHRDIKSGSILIDDNWKAKISNLEMSCKHNISNSVEHLDDSSSYSMGYVDPEYETKMCLMYFPDLYSLGVILLELLCGRSAWEEGCKDHSQSLGPLAKRHYFKKGSLDKMIFESIKEQTAPKSLNIFQRIAIQCLDYGKLKTSQVVSELKEALKFQEDYEIWEPNLLPVDYKEIIRSMPTNSEINNPLKTKKAQYNMFTKGVLLEGRKVLFSLGSDGERNEMISSRMFSYRNRTSYRWQSIQESRFKKVAKMFDISKLNIQIDVTTRFLSPGVNYGAYIIFKFCDTRKSSSKPMYVNLKYKKGGENLHAYFATWRDDEWMMIELCRFVAHKKDTRFEALLESFSRCTLVYIDGIEFRVIDSVSLKTP
ncbi:uncharacterized protein LOC143547631 [Bidens hawaiensis]|uniref:uncharacterized protein LOC143547631 n=1 Tax=Bidens hawaiensis TaxID=980011 RepID=UPI00404A147A